MDGLVQSRVTGLFQGVSRQPPLLRSPNQLDEAENVYPSVDASGSPRRPGTRVAFGGLFRPNYAQGPHHFFKTTDGNRWVLLRRVGGLIEVRNLYTGALATITTSPAAEGYLNAGTRDLKFLQIADTTLILNTSVTVQATVQAKPALDAVYLWVRRTSSAKQDFTADIASIGYTVTESLPNNNDRTREQIAQALLTKLGTTWGPLGINVALVPQQPTIIKLTGRPDLLPEVGFRNSWDPAGVLLIKGSVPAASDLPPSLEDGVVLAVDRNQGDPRSIFYVRYSRADNAWIESSYLPNGQATATLSGSTLPVRLRQTGTNSFDLSVCPWVPRNKGDDTTNPVPFFVGKRITDLAVWKGRLILPCEDTLCMSQPDDLFNFWKETARESRPSDPIELPATSDSVDTINHVVPFRNTLFVAADDQQMEVAGDRPLTPENAAITPTTRYPMNPACRPVTVGDALYFAGTAQGRNALWQYFYEEAAASNTAFDLTKHVPDYIPGVVTKIAGTAQTGRLFVTSSLVPNVVWTYTQYWAGTERVQSAWVRGIVLDPSETIEDFAAVDDALYLVVSRGTSMTVLWVPMDAQEQYRPGASLELPYCDRMVSTVPTWNEGGGYTSFPIPATLSGLVPRVYAFAVGEEWWREYSGTVVGSELRVTGNVSGLAEYYLGVPFRSLVRLSPFYMSNGDRATPIGRLQVRQVVVDFSKTGDFTAQVERSDRSPPMTVERNDRVVGTGFIRPRLGRDVSIRIPFHSRGDAARLTLWTESGAPWNPTSYTVLGRYTNPTHG